MNARRAKYDTSNSSHSFAFHRGASDWRVCLPILRRHQAARIVIKPVIAAHLAEECEQFGFREPLLLCARDIQIDLPAVHGNQAVAECCCSLHGVGNHHRGGAGTGNQSRGE